MKIGILTFHWGTNYGGVLQSYALQTFLSKNGHDVFIIDYKPARYNKSLLRIFTFSHIIYFLALFKNGLKGKISISLSFKIAFVDYITDYIKEIKMQKFRSKYLNTTRHYNSFDDLKRTPPGFDAYVCGSDQVWNPFFTTKGEGKPTATYFLGFGNASVKKIAYAVSFGCEEYPDEAKDIARNFIKSFTAISVREKSGVSIVKDLGFENPVMLIDPTLLLVPSDYLFSLKNNLMKDKNSVFSYFLRGDNNDIKSLEQYLTKMYAIHRPDSNFSPYTVEEWISSIKNANLVITNSFHGMVFSIIFHVPFIVLLSQEDQSKMNDRFYTLLEMLALNERVIVKFDTRLIETLIAKRIDWYMVDDKIIELRSEVDQFLKKYLS